MQDKFSFQMQTNKRLWLLVILMIGVTITTSVFSLRSNGQDKSIIANQDRKDISEREKQQIEFYSQFPTADYDAPEIYDTEKKAARKYKNQRYDNRSLVTNEIAEAGDERLVVLESISTPDIPTAESDLIVTGEILDAQAFLSNNKKGVYSEFTIRVDEVLKTNLKNIIPKVLVKIDREGGFVRYMNGQKRLYRIGRLGMPRIGEKYLLFLNNPEKSQNYNILTGYQLKANEVFNLDSFPQFVIHKGENKTNFMDSIRKNITESLETKIN